MGNANTSEEKKEKRSRGNTKREKRGTKSISKHVLDRKRGHIPSLMKVPKKLPDIEWLQESLQAAIELEHATIPPYLTAMWSIKSPADPVYGIFRSIVMEEMFHMALACNMLTSIGGSPNINTPGFVPSYPGPLPGGIKPNLIIPLQGLTLNAVYMTFMQIEAPDADRSAGPPYNSIGDFYNAILEAFISLNPKITSERQISVGTDVFPITNLDDVKKAISQIVDQGEGLDNGVNPLDGTADGEFAHYWLFSEVYHGKKLIKEGGAWVFKGDPIPFPECYSINGATPPSAASRTFDATYSSLLDVLHSCWQPNGPDISTAFGIMFQLSTPALTIISSGYAPDWKYVSSSHNIVGARFTNVLNTNESIAAKKVAVNYWVNVTFKLQQEEGKINGDQVLFFKTFDDDAYSPYNIAQFVQILSNTPAPTIDHEETLENYITAISFANDALKMNKTKLDIEATATLIKAKDDLRTLTFYWEMFLSIQKKPVLKQEHRKVFANVVTEVATGVPTTYNDWSDLLTFTPQVVIQPKSWAEVEEQLVNIWPRIGKDLSCVRVLGSLHSCAPIWEGQAILDLSLVPNDSLEWLDDNTVTADANYRLRTFLTDVSAKGKTLPATGGTDEQTLAGLISTNTAPATSTVTMYSGLQMVEFMTVVDGKIAFNRVNSTDDSFPSAVCSLGALGVVRRVTFKLVDKIFFQTVQKIVPLTDMLQNLDATTAATPFWRIDWLPVNNNGVAQGLIWTAVPIPEGSAKPDGDYPDDSSESILVFIAKYINDWGKAGPLTNEFLNVIYTMLAAFYGVDTCTGPLRNMLPVDRKAPMHVAMAEWGFDPADRFKVIDAINAYFLSAKWPNLPVEIELTKTDNYCMSAWNWEGLDYIIKFNFMYMTDSCPTEDLKQKIWDHIQGMWNFLLEQKIKFKAHWAKMNFMDAEFVSKNMQSEIFKKYIQRQFVNPYLSQRISPLEFES